PRASRSTDRSRFAADTHRARGLAGRATMGSGRSPSGYDGLREEPIMRTERVTFTSNGETIVGDLYLPDGDGPKPAVVTDGPLTSVKEQAQGSYARAMADRGFVALSFDHRHFGESGG